LSGADVKRALAFLAGVWLSSLAVTAWGQPAPADEPPLVLSRFQGLRVTPVSGLSLDALQPNSVVVVLPTIAAP